MFLSSQTSCRARELEKWKAARQTTTGWWEKTLTVERLLFSSRKGEERGTKGMSLYEEEEEDLSSGALVLPSSSLLLLLLSGVILLLLARISRSAEREKPFSHHRLLGREVALSSSSSCSAERN